MIGLTLLFTVACAAEAGATGVGTDGDVTVPDEVTTLDRDELDRRLGRLLAGEGHAMGAPVAGASDEPPVDDVLHAIDPMKPLPAEVVVTISPITLSRLTSPVLKIKSAPGHGSVTVRSPSSIVYTPDGTGDGTDSFEYELFDTGELIVAQVFEVRQ